MAICPSREKGYDVPTITCSTCGAEYLATVEHVCPKWLEWLTKPLLAREDNNPKAG